VPIVKIEHHGVGRRLTPAMLPAYLGGTDHGRRSRDAALRAMPTRSIMDGSPGCLVTSGRRLLPA
jgi:hypothetical protein